AFDAEVALWKHEDVAVAQAEAAPEPETALREGERLVSADMGGNIWKIPVQVGQSVAAGDTLVVVEAMKMELSVIAPVSGTVTAIRCVPGKPV
ncbi:acetyl-CoA carboxylase biotin carboxyl carrier protein subunit, partial [Salmonella enterica]|nr:acetyl-CoA carboxylase biotin carboxyl carrier protein subunit [Salmonella enterica]